MSRGRIAYVLSRFPYLPETFTLREMLALEGLDWDIDLFAIQRQHDSVSHPEAERLAAAGHYLFPFGSATVGANARLLRHNPALYGRLLRTVAQGNRSSRDFLLKGLAAFPGIVQFAETMRARKVEHIHAQYSTHSALVALLAAEILGVSFSFAVHAHDIFVDATMLEEKVRRAAFVLAISDFNRRWLAENLGLWAVRKTHVIHCGVALQMYPFQPFRGPRDRPWSLLSVGSLQQYKGHEHLVRACALLRETAPDIPFKCQIVGHGPLASSLGSLIAELDLSDCVTLLGPRDQYAVRTLMAEADILALPSVVAPDGQMEGIPIVLMEAMALGLPVVASALSGIPELVRAGDTGLLAGAGDAEMLKEAILRIIRHPEEAADRARRARALVEADFNLSTSVRALSGLFDRTLEERTPNRSLAAAS